MQTELNYILLLLESQRTSSIQEIMGIWSYHDRIRSCTRLLVYEVVPSRDQETLLPILDKCLKPGSEVHTDDFGAYSYLERHLPQKIVVHRVVNHSINFVDPGTGVHTQNIESKWAKLKQQIKERKGILREDLQSYLNEKMYREWNGTGEDFLIHLFSSITLMFPSTPV